MRTLIFIIFLLFMIEGSVVAQEARLERFYAKGDSIVLVYSMEGKVKRNNGFIIQPKLNLLKQNKTVPVQTIRGDTLVHLNSDQDQAVRREIVWNVFADWTDGYFPTVDSFGFEMDFSLRTKRRPIILPNHWAVSYAANTNSPLGLSLQRLGKWGAYLSAKMLPIPRQTTGEVENNGILFNENAPYLYNPKRAVNSYSISAGLTRSLGTNNYLYLGGGYGVKQLLWQVIYLNEDLTQTASDEWRINTTKNYDGMLLETGLYWKVGKFLIDTGLGVIFSDFGVIQNVDQVYGNVGIGYILSTNNP